MFKIILLLLLSLPLFPQDTWEESAPKADKFDWVQTTSGEWLKGKIKGMYKEELEFDSEDFNLQIIEWKDIKRLKSHSTTSLNIENKGVLTGQLNMHDSFIYLTMENDTVILERDDIISITRAGTSEISYWSGFFSLGISLNGGNTKKEDYTSTLSLKQQKEKRRFQVNSLSNYSKTNDVATESNARLNSSLDIFQTRRFFLRPGFVEYFTDTFQNIREKITYGLGAGYDIYSTPRTTWTVLAGPAYQTTTFEAVTEGQSKTEETPAAFVISDYDIELTKNVDFILKYQAYFVNKQSGTYVHHAISSIKTEFIDDFDFDVTFIWDRVKDPTKDELGNIPKKDDYKTTLSIAYNF